MPVHQLVQMPVSEYYRWSAFMREKVRRESGRVGCAGDETGADRCRVRGRLLMAQVKILTDRDFASAQAFQKALFGHPKGAFGVLEDAQQDAMVEEVQRVQRDSSIQKPESFRGQKGTQVTAKVPLSAAAAYVKDMPFATVLRLWDTSEAKGADQDILPTAIRMMALLKLMAGPSSNARKNHTHRYRDGFRYVIGDVPYKFVPAGLDYTVIGITNVAPHAPTLENPGWPRPFTKGWQKIQRLATKENFDAKFTYLSGSSIPQFRKAYFESLGDPPGSAFPIRSTTPYGVYLRASDYGHRRLIRYTVPVIWLGPLNSMRGRTGRIQAKHRSRRRKR